MFEWLETRTLMAFDSFVVDPILDPPPAPPPGVVREPFVISGTTIVVNGTEGPDTIIVRNNYVARSVDVERNGEIRSFALAGFTGIVLNGYGENDTLRMESTENVGVTLNGGPGQDNLQGGIAGDILNGGDGHDTLRGGGGNDQLNGGYHNDVLRGNLGQDVMSGGEGRDEVSYDDKTAQVRAFLTATAISGTAGEADTIQRDVEIIRGGRGNDQLYAPGLSGITLYGGDGNDTLYGNGGAEVLDGQWGDDELIGSGGDDVLRGDRGNDVIRAGEGNDRAFGGDGLDRIWGDAGNDYLAGGDDDDKLHGEAGNDSMYGEGGSDLLISVGGGDFDSLVGGSGFDSFWADHAATETVADVDTLETEKRTLHRVDAFDNPVAAIDGRPVFSKELIGQNLLDPSQVEATTSRRNLKNLPLFGSRGPRQDDVIQGNLGDCWFLATIGAVAGTDPEFIRQTITELGDGTYAVRFAGERYFRVDADLRVTPTFFNNGTWKGDMPVYAGLGQDAAGNDYLHSSPGASLWVALLEKAAVHYFSNATEFWGIPFESYESLDGGWSEDAFAALGVASIREDSGIDSGSETIAWIEAQLAEGRAVTLCTQHSFWGVSDRLSALHCYTVDSVVTDSEGRKLLRLRNPWGSDGDGAGGDANEQDGYLTITGTTAYDSFSSLWSARLY